MTSSDTHAATGMAASALASDVSDPARHAREVASGERFEFGSNWAKFLALVDDDRIRQAEDSLRAMLKRDTLDGLSFLDIGSGSGLFSLAARRLGARVRSFDYDPQSVACTAELRRRYFPDDASWQVGQGSVLDESFITGLGTFDVVYSWGVLHHTGQMWRALDLAQRAVKPGGQLFIAIYNDTGSQTTRWKALKKTYVSLPRPLRPAFAALAMLPEEAKSAASAVLRGRPLEYVRTWTGYRTKRGMSKWRDIVDWVGGYPYEAAKPDAIFSFFHDRGYQLEGLNCMGGLGCNEFLFRKEDEGTGAMRNSEFGTRN
jgi:2-polyprenyl-3-methyl-5-hydroxy-6-metoxy-1,4-benzoquinol methylase